MKNQHLILFFIATIFSSCNKDEEQMLISNQELNDKYEVVASGFTIPWGIEVINEGEFLFTERLGKLYHYKEGSTKLVANIPLSQTVSSGGLVFGGLMDVSLHPNFATNNLVYICYVDRDYFLVVAKFELINNFAENLEIIFNSDQFSIGSRIVWQDNNHFFL